MVTSGHSSNMAVTSFHIQKSHATRKLYVSVFYRPGIMDDRSANMEFWHCLLLWPWPWPNSFHFANAVVTVDPPLDSSHMTASSSASWSSCSLPLNFVNGHARVHDMAHSLLLATVACRWFGKSPLVKKCMAWALTCLKTVQQRPWLTREIETKLPDSSISDNGVVDHRNRLPVLSPLCSCVNVVKVKV